MPLSEADIEEVMVQYREYIHGERQVPEHVMLCKDIVGDGNILSFMNTETTVLMTVRGIDILILSEALRKLTDWQKWSLVSAEDDEMELEEGYREALISDTVVGESLYRGLLNVVQELVEKFNGTEQQTDEEPEEEREEKPEEEP